MEQYQWSSTSAAPSLSSLVLYNRRPVHQRTCTVRTTDVRYTRGPVQSVQQMTCAAPFQCSPVPVQ
jgi:hypothetical protein